MMEIEYVMPSLPPQLSLLFNKSVSVMIMTEGPPT